MNVAWIRHLIHELLIEEHNLEFINYKLEKDEDVFRDYIQKFVSVNIKKFSQVILMDFILDCHSGTRYSRNHKIYLL